MEKTTTIKEARARKPGSAVYQPVPIFDVTYEISGLPNEPPHGLDCEGDFEINAKDSIVEMEIRFDLSAPGYRHCATLHLTPKRAREIAYSLLLFANDLE
jgi:hypothetical protein